MDEHATPAGAIGTNLPKDAGPYGCRDLHEGGAHPPRPRAPRFLSPGLRPGGPGAFAEPKARRQRRTMTELARQVDPRSLNFGLWGLGGAMSAELQERLLREQMDVLQLGAAVPEQVRSQFEKLKALYRNGLYSYESFTHAERDAYRVLEVALKVRFLEHYRHQVPVIVARRQQVIECRTFGELQPVLARRGQLVGHPRFDGSFAALLRWARAEDYFHGQRNRIRELVTPKLRNEVQHSEFDYLHMLPDVLRTIGLHFQWIQKLWGYFTPGGDAYSGPLRRSPWVIGRWAEADESTWFPVELIPTADGCERPGGVFYVVLAVDREHLSDWRADVEQTMAPVDLLWGPGAWGELCATVDAATAGWKEDEVDVLDRVFYVQVVNGGIAPARSARQVAALHQRVAGERWYVVKADGPGMARHHVMELLGRDLQEPAERHSLEGPCPRCAAESVISGATRETVAAVVGTGDGLVGPD
jgi:hypothetical protein